MAISGSFTQMLSGLSDEGLFRFAILALVAIIATMGLVMLVLYTIDSWFLPLKVMHAQVLEKIHHQACFSVREDIDGLTKMPAAMVVDLPERWLLRINTRSGERLIGVSRGVYDSAVENGNVPVHYGIGRLSGREYLKAIV
jgi:hypothetical protein